jgi:hypothetical protein
MSLLNFSLFSVIIDIIIDIIIGWVNLFLMLILSKELLY